MAINAKGKKGSCVDYVKKTYQKTKQLGNEDKYIENFWREIEKLRSK